MNSEEINILIAIAQTETAVLQPEEQQIAEENERPKLLESNRVMSADARQIHKLGEEAKKTLVAERVSSSDIVSRIAQEMFDVGLKTFEEADDEPLHREDFRKWETLCEAHKTGWRAVAQWHLDKLNAANARTEPLRASATAKPKEHDGN